MWLENKGKVFVDKKGEKKAIIISRDITVRKLAEQELKKSEEKYRNLVENQTDLIIKIDPKGKILFSSPSFCRILGKVEEQIIGKIGINFVHKDDHSLLVKSLIALRHPPHNNQMEIRILTINGWRWFSWVNTSLLDNEKKVTTVISVGRDITERKKAERLIREEMDKLKELDQMRRDFISRASHELKTPLTAIHGAIQVLFHLYKDQLGENALEFAEMIKEGSTRLKKLVEKLLDISRSESEKIQLNRKMENIVEIITNCANNIIFLANERDISLNIELPESYYIKVDRFRMEQVITNLLSNAIKNTPPKGEISISREESNGDLEIYVKDNGVGLTESEINKIFKKFGKIKRYGKGLDVSTEGSGLGLFISKEIIELHGGEILVKSEGRNKGSKFTIKLPKK